MRGECGDEAGEWRDETAGKVWDEAEVEAGGSGDKAGRVWDEAGRVWDEAERVEG